MCRRYAFQFQCFCCLDRWFIKLEHNCCILDLFLCKKPWNLTNGALILNDEEDLCAPEYQPWKQRTDKHGLEQDDGVRYKVGCAGNFSCNEGHLISENKTVMCSSTGEWGDWPRCERGNIFSKNIYSIHNNNRSAKK